MTEERRERIRLVLALDPDGCPPMVVGALTESIWEVIPEEDWEKVRRGMLAASGMSPHDYTELAECVVSVDYAAFKALAEPPTLAAEVEAVS